ncbi:MAG: HEAT repeat domain-containing protein [Candidatus Eremiobacterota bacterium]
MKEWLDGLVAGNPEDRLAATEAILEAGAAAIERGGAATDGLSSLPELAGEYAEPLARVFTQEHLLVRSAAYLCLKAMGQAAGGALAHLVEGLEDPRGEVRACSAELLGSLKGSADPAADALLLALCDEGREDVREPVARVLADMARRQPELKRRLEDLVRDERPYCRDSARLALGLSAGVEEP